MSRAKLLVLVGVALGVLSAPFFAARLALAAEYVLLSRGVTSSEGGRMLLAASFLVAGRAAPPPPGWMRPDFDDSAWAALPVTASGSGASLLGKPVPPGPNPGVLWTTASPSSSASGVSSAPGSPAAGAGGAGADAGAIFSEDLPSDGGVLDAASPAVAAPVAAAPVDAGAPQVPPPCAGTLYLRRRFSVSAAELSRLSAGPATLTLRIRYSDGFAAYLNGVEMARRKLPDASLTEPQTLASERGTVEPESHYVQIPLGLLLAEGNVLAVEVHPRAPERCPRAELELLGSDLPRVVRGPYIERLLDGALDLTLETDSPTHIEVVYGKTEIRHSRDRRIVSASEPGAQPQTLHRVHITGLRPGQTYHYQVTVISPDKTPGARVELPLVAIHTPPASPHPLRLVVYGDSRSGHAIHAQVIQSILEEDPDLVLNIGDIVERGTEDSDWDRFFAVASPLLQKLPLYLAPGNHEYARRGQGAQKLFQIWSRQFPVQLPPSDKPPLHMLASTKPTSDVLAESGPRGYHSFDVAGVHIVALDSNQLRAAEQREWLDADLERAAARRPRAILVFMHDGPYSMGWHGDNSTLIRDYVPIFERYRVSMVFSGHDHDFERGRRGKLDYIVTGGGGAELRPLKCGVPGKRRCKHPPLAFYNEHNYVSVEVLPGALRVCPKRPDATPLEPCQLVRR